LCHSRPTPFPYTTLFRSGLQQNFEHAGGKRLTSVRNHGFDFAVGLTKRGFGGWATLSGNVLSSGIFNSDTSVGRAQMILIHELGDRKSTRLNSSHVKISY